MSTWVSLFEGNIEFGSWTYTDVINDASIFKFTHNYTEGDQNAIAIIEQADLASTISMYGVKRFALDPVERILSFERPPFYTNRALGVFVYYTGNDETQTNVHVKIEYYTPSLIPPTADKEQINRIENKIDSINNQYLIKNYTLYFEDN